ncbi:MULTISPECIES: glycogen/starch synthase [unclassified Pseudoalteromonas]|uniref:glycogen synthase n=1 Tax=unclassified Pseudoalteromonas TaxID=194690 RepID=UPI000C068F16|nr:MULTISPECIES: glycogen/starch synthase [unclassified Pseudoalteromonas]MDP2633147.1 glycogen/starch synthase [Pseudoalteromonas sp. 1_MG-2023]PHN91874.1 glycogen synthase [Pseudoalteromonas sp. 3D05]
MHVLMVAAENDALPNAKVGGVADVIRDCPNALSNKGIFVDVIIPDYGFSQLDRERLGTLNVAFAGQSHQVDVWQVHIANSSSRQLVLSHHYFSQHNGNVYCNDEPGRPFATDATKFAFFGAAVCEGLLQGIIPCPDVIHLHDWHSACVALLLKFDKRYETLLQTKLVFTVHNIALQGIRPFKGDESSLEAWFPSLGYDGHVICDPRYPHCFNPMRSAINLADKVHLVSPSYAKEVVLPSEPDKGFFGGEGLEKDLQKAADMDKVVGVLNGCEYTPNDENPPSFEALYNAIETELFIWLAKNKQLESGYYIAHQRLLSFIKHDDKGPLLTSVGRLTDQKVLLLRQPYNNKLLVDELCKELSKFNGKIIILGSGDSELEDVFTQAMARNTNLLFLKGYGQKIGELLYQLGDLFLMPSSFEPCGISQMLAMRAGQPCLVHQVGGLNDTVTHLENGFCFDGNTLELQCKNLLNCFIETLTLYSKEPKKWQHIVNNARNARFTWDDVAQQYIETMYK